jgi:hypothetical protein
VVYFVFLTNRTLTMMIIRTNIAATIAACVYDIAGGGEETTVGEGDGEGDEGGGVDVFGVGVGGVEGVGVDAVCATLSWVLEVDEEA